MYQHSIKTYGREITEVIAVLSSHLSLDYRRGWSVSMPDAIVETPDPFYPWRKVTGGNLEAYNVYTIQQRALMDAAIAATEEDLSNAV